MFTGLIEHTSQITSLKETEQLLTLEIRNPYHTLKTGDSVSVNGTCLTVTGVKDTFTVDIINETKRITAFSEVKEGDTVNLERAMKMSDRLDGHMVSGHVDGTGEIMALNVDGDAVVISIQCPKHLMKYMVHKGSVTIDGISLTLFEVDASNNLITLNIIPETYRKTRVHTWRKGSLINIEADMMMKHIDHLMQYEGSVSNV